MYYTLKQNNATVVACGYLAESFNASDPPPMAKDFSAAPPCGTEFFSEDRQAHHPSKKIPYRKGASHSYPRFLGSPDACMLSFHV